MRVVVAVPSLKPNQAQLIWTAVGMPYPYNARVEPRAAKSHRYTLPNNMNPQTVKPALVSVAREATLPILVRAAGILPAR